MGTWPTGYFTGTPGHHGPRFSKRDSSTGPHIRLSPPAPATIMDYDKTTLLSLPTEVLLQVLLAVDEPWAIHHTAKLFLALSEVRGRLQGDMLAKKLFRTSITSIYVIPLSLCRSLCGMR
ncbi:hypothetical protein FRC08_002013 [Ceratobasidium sp. 394]|nr:hypothetical protein FRC08_002013 [Ceratobasidium sp. 394]